MRTPQHYVNTSLCFDTSHSQWSICLDSTTQKPYKGAVSYSSWSWGAYGSSWWSYSQLYCPLMCFVMPPLRFKND